MIDERMRKVIVVLKENFNKGLSITEIVKISKLSRYMVLTALAKLEGAKKVRVRNIGMVKLYFLEEENEKQ